MLLLGFIIFAAINNGPDYFYSFITICYFIGNADVGQGEGWRGEMC